ncbi:MAG: hypothetical protein HOY79_40050 [Streptomyces sp.]|nr:hypothetical protein [Streptomyces sp.]
MVIDFRSTRLLAFGDALLSSPGTAPRVVRDLGRRPRIRFADVVFGRVRPCAEGAAWHPL